MLRIFIEFFEFNYLLRDIKTILNIIFLVNKNKNTPDWQSYRLRVDWIYRIYTVINPRKEDEGDDQFMLLAKNEERILRYHRYIDKIGLAKYVKVAKERIEDTNSILLVYYPLLIWINFRNILILLIFIYLYNRFNEEILFIFNKILNILFK